jgi:hypothetical protein
MLTTRIPGMSDALAFAGGRSFLRKMLLYQVNHSKALLVEADGAPVALVMFYSHRARLADGKAAVEQVLASLTEEEADGLYCYFHPDQGLWVDVCDWGDPDAGERVVRAFCEAAGLEDEEGERPNPFVRVENEAAKPGTGWERLG